MFEPDALSRFRAEFRWIQQATGDARDLDVYLLEFDEMRALVPEPIRPDLDALHEVLASRRASRAAQDGPGAALRADVARCCPDWSSFLDRLGGRRPGRRPPVATRSGRSASSPASGSRRCTRGWSSMGDAIGPDSPAGRLPRAPQAGQGAPLPARAVRRAAVQRAMSSSR